MTQPFDADAALGGLRELYARILDDDPAARAADLAAAVKALDNAMCAGYRPPTAWLQGQSQPRGVATKRGHLHAEAYCLMRYVADEDPGEVEVIWNSRDGVTPFVIALRSGHSASHDFEGDRYDRDYVPKPGERVFAAMTEELSVQVAERNYDRFAASGEPGIRRRLIELGDRRTAVRYLAAQYNTPGAPVLLAVTDEGWTLGPLPGKDD